MAKTVSYYKELQQLQNYIESDANEDSKRPLLYPIFKLLFKDKFKIESAANNADVYIEGQIIVEAKTNYSQWVKGFYQALHYKKKYGLSYNTIIVIAHDFCGIWKLKLLPEYAVTLANTADATKSPSEMGNLNASKTQNAQQIEIKESSIYWLEPKDLREGKLFEDRKNLITETYEILKFLNNPDSERIQVNKHNFIQTIEKLKYFFPTPIQAVHAFYSIIPFWDITSQASRQGANEDIIISGHSGHKSSDKIDIDSNKKNEFEKFINTQYIFTNEGSGLTVDYYFSRFDEVLAVIDPEYVKQHGIFFTDDNLSKFALWFAKNEVTETIHENYVVFDPAGGSGNLVSSYRGRLKHKIISELQPDLLKIIEKRMKADPWHIETGFTIVPKTINDEGLNFLDRSAEEYYAELEKAVLNSTKKTIDKPLAFLLNPPYKNTDEKESARVDKNAEYQIHSDILALTGSDAGKERYLAFLGQILNLCEVQTSKISAGKPLVMIFTPTSWLIPRPTYVEFRNKWDAKFRYLNGFIVTSNEFFKLNGKWPVAFTIWEYEPKENRINDIRVLDLTTITKQHLAFNWNDKEKELNNQVDRILEEYQKVKLDNSRGDIRYLLPEIMRNGKMVRQTRFDFSTAKRPEDFNKLVSGFPLKDSSRHFELSRKCGNPCGNFIGLMDDTTPCRINQDNSNRMSNEPDRIWFQLRPTFIDINLTKILGLAPDKYGYCAYEKESAQVTFTWFAISKALNGKYPIWANQYDLWLPNISKEMEVDWYALCYVFGLAENRCVVTKFEKDNPIEGAPEIWVDNPMSPNNQECFYRTTLQSEIKKSNSIATELADEIERFYQYWNLTYTRGQILENVGLKNEAYFKYFDYPDFVTKDSGLVQIRKYAEVNECRDLIEMLTKITAKTKLVREEIYRMLVEDFKYFE